MPNHIRTHWSEQRKQAFISHFESPFVHIFFYFCSDTIVCVLTQVNTVQVQTHG